MPRSKNQLAQTKFTRTDLKDSATKERIYKHLSDINDTISEEDIKNINTDISIPEAALEYGEVEQVEETDNIEQTKLSGNKQLETPWNIIDEQ